MTPFVQGFPRSFAHSAHPSPTSVSVTFKFFCLSNFQTCLPLSVPFVCRALCTCVLFVVSLASQLCLVFQFIFHSFWAGLAFVFGVHECFWICLPLVSQLQLAFPFFTCVPLVSHLSEVFTLVPTNLPVLFWQCFHRPCNLACNSFFISSSDVERVPLFPTWALWAASFCSFIRGDHKCHDPIG